MYLKIILKSKKKKKLLDDITALWLLGNLLGKNRRKRCKMNKLSNVLF